MQFAGNIPDVTAFSALLREAGIDEKDCIFIADKGFGSEDNFDLVDGSLLHYMTPLKRGSLEVRGKVPNSQFDYEYGFIYHKRPILAKRIDCEGYAVHLFLDPSLLAEETAGSPGWERRMQHWKRGRERSLAAGKRARDGSPTRSLQPWCPACFPKRFQTRRRWGPSR
jgi:hypothetical protein